MDFAGIEVLTEVVDLSAMNTFHIDVWTDTSFDFIAGVVDFGGDGFGGDNADSRGDVRETLMANQWTSIDVSISNLQAAGLTATPTDFAQLILDVVDVTGTIFVDNIYFYNDPNGGGDTGGSAPSEAAPMPPARDAADVISLFSNAYTNINVDTFYAEFSQGGGLQDIQVEGDDVKQYTGLDFAGVETIAATVDISGMTHFHIDVWTPLGITFKNKLVDFLGDGFDGPNGVTEGEVTRNLTMGQWNSLDIPISEYVSAGLTGTMDFSQLILDVDAVTGTIFVDNIYFYSNN